MKIVVLFVVLFVAVIVRCQDLLEEDAALNSEVEQRSEKEKRGIALNLGGSGLEGYSYFGPTSRGLNRGYGGYGSGFSPMADYGYDGVNYGMNAQNFAGGYQGGYGGYNSMPHSPYSYGGYRGGYPTSYQNFRLYNSPVNTYPLGGIGTVGPYGGAYGVNNPNRLGGGIGGGMDGLYQPGLY